MLEKDTPIKGRTFVVPTAQADQFAKEVDTAFAAAPRFTPSKVTWDAIAEKHPEWVREETNA